MTNKFTPSYKVNETQVTNPEPPVDQGIVASCVINADWGYGNTVLSFNELGTWEKMFGIPNDYNAKMWWIARDYLIGGGQLNAVRAIPTSAKNASVKLNGISHLSLDAWYSSNTVKSLERLSDFYNPENAENQILEESFTTLSKLQIVNRYVTAKQTLAVAVCSNANHYEQPIFNERVDVIQKFEWYQEPSAPVDNERYKLTRDSMAITGTLLGAGGAASIYVTGDYSSLVAATELLITVSGLSETGTYIGVTSATYSVSTGLTTIVLDGALTETLSVAGTATYLTGTNWYNKVAVDGYIDGVVVEYDATGASWDIITPTVNVKYYVGSLGQIWYYDGASWVQDVNSDYLAVDADGDGKYEYAIKNIFDADLYNADNSLKSFKDIYKENLDFAYGYNSSNAINYDEVLVFVFQKSETNDKWYKVEEHLGSYIATARDANNNPFSIERVIMDDSNLVYAKVGTPTTYNVTNDTLAIAADEEYTITGSITAATKTLVVTGQDVTGSLIPGKTFVLAGTSNDGTYTVVTAVFSTDSTIVVSEVFAGGDDTLTADTLTVSYGMTVAQDLQNFQIGEKVKYSDFVLAAADVSGEFTISGVSESAGTATLTFVEDLIGYTVDTGSSISNIYSGKVSTNMNKYANVNDAAYDITNDDASDGFAISDMLIYDTAPTDSEGTTITDYSNVTAAAMSTAADYLKDKDNVDCDLLLSYETVDEYNNHHQDKLAEVSEYRKDSYALVAPWDESLFLGLSNEQRKTNVITEFGGQRTNLYNGTFTKFGKFSGVSICSMKYIEDTYNNKFRWVPATGDIARMAVKLDNGKGIWFPLANSPDGEMNNAIKWSYLPTESEREELGKNHINNIFKPRGKTYPVLFSNYTSYRLNNLFKVQSYRLMLNKIENYIKDNVYPKFFKFKTDQLYKNLRDAIEVKLDEIVTSGGLLGYDLQFPEIVGEPSNTVTMKLVLYVAGVVEHFILNIELDDTGVKIEEAVV